MNNPRAGFTLIELLVVIGILGILIAAFVPDIIGMQVNGYKAADRANLRWHFSQLQQYKLKHKRYPNVSGHQFVLASWVDRVTERTEENLGRYFTPGLGNEQQQVLREEGVDNIWKSYNDISSEDTDYAGLNKKLVKGRMDSGKKPWMSNDNQYGPAFEDHTIHVLMGSGKVREIVDLDLEREYGFDLDGEDVFEVGPGSPHPLLKQLIQ